MSTSTNFDIKGYVPYTIEYWYAKYAYTQSESDEERKHHSQIILSSDDVFSLEIAFMIFFIYNAIFNIGFGILSFIPFINIISGLINFVFNGFWQATITAYIFTLYYGMKAGHQLRTNSTGLNIIYSPDINIAFTWNNCPIWKTNTYIKYTPDLVIKIIKNVECFDKYILKNVIHTLNTFGIETLYAIELSKNFAKKYV